MKETKKTQQLEGNLIMKRLEKAFQVPRNSLFMYGGLYSYNIQYVNGKISMTEVPYKESSVRVALTQIATFSNKEQQKVFKQTAEEDYSLFMQYMLQNRTLKDKPNIVVEGWCTYENKHAENGFVWRKDLRDIERSERIKVTTALTVQKNLNIGEFKCRLGFAKPNKVNPEALKALLKIIFYKPEHYKTFLDFTALFAFENRYGKSKPTLVLYGDRNTGKNVAVEHFLGAIYPNTTTPVPPNYEQFQEYAQNNKLAIFDETGEDSNKARSLTKIGLFLKQQSGTRYNSVNIKNSREKNIESGVYYAVMSNEIPISVKEMPNSDDNNQWIALKLKESKAFELGMWKDKYLKGTDNNDISDFVQDHIGHFIQNDLFTHYCNLKIEGKTKNWRYGMSVPVNQESKELYDQSEPGWQVKIKRFIKDLVNGDIPTCIDNDFLSEEHRFQCLLFGSPKLSVPSGEFGKSTVNNDDKKKGILTVSLLNAIKKADGLTQLQAPRMEAYFEKCGWFTGIKTHRTRKDIVIGGRKRKPECYQFNFDVVKRFCQEFN